ncbi:hypothetical protein Q7P37_009823 [Cladosporium fusiforme]
MRRQHSFTRTLAVSLLLQGVALGLLGENSGQLDLDVAVTYSLKGPTTTFHESAQTDVCDSFDSTQQQKDTTTAIRTKTDDTSGAAEHLPASVTSTSGLIHTTGALIDSGSSTDPSMAPWSSTTRSRVIETTGKPSSDQPLQATTIEHANVSHANTTSYPASSFWPSIVSAQPPTDNYTGLWSPPNPSATRESSAAHALGWNNHIALGALICGVLGLS